LSRHRLPMDTRAAYRFVDALWNDSIISQLIEYIRIPCKSPHFDKEWRANGHIDRAVALIESWCRKQPIAGLHIEVLRPADRTPLIYMEIPGIGDKKDDTVLLYGHMDKQPEMSGWEEGLGPWTPVLRDGKLYGRGGADDGYSAFASLAAIRALHEQKLPHARCVVLIEACDESGSYDLPGHIETLSSRIGKPSLVVCLDSGCGNYEQFWSTTSLRGLVGGVLRVQVLKEGVHSGDASGVVASSFRIVRTLLSRIEDEKTGAIIAKEFHVDIPSDRQQQALGAAKTLGTAVYDKFPFVRGMKPMASELPELVINRTWRPALSITGADGLPALGNAGNVLRPATAVKISLRLPPTLNGAKAAAALKALIEKDPPYGAKVEFIPEEPATGWNAPPLAPWLQRSLDDASQTFFAKPSMSMGEGGTIPFMAMLGEKFPAAQFVITGVLGPQSNAHGPNEFLHIEMGKKLTACVAKILFDHGQRRTT
ncbi:MAG TPA: M20 family metallopeptidase, partial [Steroidobacteraceae bacterium]|nr:M20 family metallopeptidase [Steroidobacteraceae bacterium]